MGILARMRIESVTGTEIQPSQAGAAEATLPGAPGTQLFSRGNLSPPKALLWAAAAVACFHLAYSTPYLAAVTIGYLFSLLQLMRARTGRQAFYLSLGAGMFIAAPQLSCF